MLTGDEATGVASYLLKDLNVGNDPPNVDFAYYEGIVEQAARPRVAHARRRKGSAGASTSRWPRRQNDYAMRFGGTFRVDLEGEYSFHLTSDDGSRLSIDDREVVLNDGTHPAAGENRAMSALTRGAHRVVVDYFQGGGEAVILIDYEGPGIGRQDFAAALKTPGDPPKAEAPFVSDPALAAKGRELFASVGCASCHRMTEGGKPIAPVAASRPLAELGEGGCLAPTLAKGVPDFRLNDAQRAALSGAIEALAKPEAPAVAETLVRSMAAFNCYACHKRDGLGGVEEGRDEILRDDAEGDGGRGPHPALAGRRRRRSSRRTMLRHILAHGAKDRPYMLTRMPKFGEANAGPLAPVFESLDPDNPGPVRWRSTSRRGRSRRPADSSPASQALNCVACHTFKGVQAQGIQAIDMAMMTRASAATGSTATSPDPAALRPGTRMPPGWPMGQSMLPKVLDGDARHADRGGMGLPLRRQPAPRPPTAWAATRSRWSPRTRRSSTGTSSRGPARGRSASAIRRRQPRLRRAGLPARPDLAGGLHRRLEALDRPG